MALPKHSRLSRSRVLTRNFIDDRQIASGRVVVLDDMQPQRETNTADAPAGRSARQRAGDLFDAHFDDVYRYCLSRTADPALAEDAAAQAFYEGARRLAADGTAQVDRRWLFVVARRRVVDGWRREQRQHRVARRFESSSPDAIGVTPTHDGESVVQALRSLPDRQRQAVVLRYLDDHSVAEVAETLEVTYQAAESLLARGRRGFARAWKEQPDDSTW